MEYQDLAKEVDAVHYQNINWFAEYREKPTKLLHEFADDYSVFDTYSKFSEFFLCPENGHIGAVNAPEAYMMCSIIKKEGLKSGLEIGSFYGISTRILGHCLKMNSGHLYAIDGQSLGSVKQGIDLLHLNSTVTVIEAWSPWVKTLPDGLQLDFLFIDGDHSKIPMIVDFYYYNIFLRQNGIVAFHDINLKGVHDGIDVLKSTYALEELCYISRLRVFRKLEQSNIVYYEKLGR